MNDNGFNALAHQRRRTLLLDLLESNPQNVGVEPTGESTLTEADQQVPTEMYHVHLPKLEDYGYIERDEDAQEVVKGPQFDEIRPLLECIDDYVGR